MINNYAFNKCIENVINSKQIRNKIFINYNLISEIIFDNKYNKILYSKFKNNYNNSLIDIKPKIANMISNINTIINSCWIIDNNMDIKNEVFNLINTDDIYKNNISLPVEENISIKL